MFIRFITWLLARKKLSTGERNELMSAILNSIDALPLHAIITINEGKLFIRGIEQDGIKAVQIRESADQALNNIALQAVHEQVLYQAVSLGVHQAHTPEQIQFAKAGIWYAQEEMKLLRTLAESSYANSSLNGDL